MALASGVLTIIIIIYSMFRKIFSFDYWHSKDVPYLEPSVPFGNIKDVSKKFHIIQVIARAYDEFKNTGDKYCGIYYWTRPVAVILDLDLVKNILVKDSSNFMNKGYQNGNSCLLSANLLMVDGDNWEKLRKKFTPIFASSKMKSLFPTVLEIGNRLHSTLLEMISKKEDVLDIGDLMTRYTSDIFGDCVFGIECNSLQNKKCDFLQMAKKATNPPRRKATNPRHSIHIIKGVFKNIARKLRIKLWRDDVEEYFVNVTKDTIEYREKNFDVKRNDMMDILLNLKNDLDSGNMTTNEIAANFFGFLLAGFESSSNTLTFCLYHLAQDICIQTKARQEFESLYEQYGGKITFEMLSNMPFIDKVIQETLRQHPVEATLNRVALNNYTVSNTKHIIEKGTWIKIPIFAIHHDQKYYPDPEIFDPNRFESEEAKKRNPMTWLPFGDGPRNCIGIRFAMMQIKVGLAILLSNFEFSICSKTVKSIVYHRQRPKLSPSERIYLKVRAI